MNENNIKISVIIPVYNMQNMISNCLGSVTSQTLQDIEIICVNDGSTDKSLERLLECKKKDKRIRVFSSKNRGSGPARNIGLKNAQGEYIAFMDVDDYYPDENVLEMLYDTAKRTDADICGGSLRRVDTFGKKVQNKHLYESFHQDGYVDIQRYQWCFGYQRYIYKTELLIQNNVFFKKYRRFQDPPFMLSAMLYAETMYGIKKETYCYRTKYKDVQWNEEKVTDAIYAAAECLKLTEDKNMRWLHAHLRNAISHLIKDNMKWSYISGFKALKEIEKSTNYDWVDGADNIYVQVIKYLLVSRFKAC